MTDASLKRGVELEKLITITSNGLVEIEKMMANTSHYWLSISEHEDGSGKKAKLSRHEGNLGLLDVISCELTRQLKVFEDEFSKL